MFHNPDELHEAIDPRQERALQRKIDFMILLYLAVCYAFFYVDKTTLSYVAHFWRSDIAICIRWALNRAGRARFSISAFSSGRISSCSRHMVTTLLLKQRLTSIYIVPTNFVMQRFPIGKLFWCQYCCLGILSYAESMCL